MLTRLSVLSTVAAAAFSFGANAAILYNTPPASAGLSAYTSTITINADGSFSTTGGGPAFGGEDSFIHVINNSSASVAGFSLSGTDIFGFDQDGTLGGSTDPADYSGSLVSFTFNASNTNTGSVTFIGGLAPGSDLYFELEEDVNAAGSGFTVGGGGGGGTTSTPEPASLALLGAGLVGLAGFRARARSRS